MGNLLIRMKKVEGKEKEKGHKLLTNTCIFEKQGACFPMQIFLDCSILKSTIYQPDGIISFSTQTLAAEQLNRTKI